MFATADPNQLALKASQFSLTPPSSMHSSIRLLITGLLAACVFTACANAASKIPYQAIDYKYEGYSEKNSSENTCMVSFEANDKTSEEQTYNYSLLRAAELADRNHFKYFEVTSKRFEKVIRKEKLPAVPPRIEETTEYAPNGRAITRKKKVPGIPGAVVDVKHQVCTIQILFTNTEDQEKSHQGTEFEAKETIERLKKKYRIK